MLRRVISSNRRSFTQRRIDFISSKNHQRCVSNLLLSTPAKTRRVLFSGIAQLNLDRRPLRDNRDFLLPSLSELRAIPPEEKEARIQQLARKLQSLRDPKVLSLFNQSDDEDKYDNLVMTARKVVEYYTSDPSRFLPLQNSTNADGNGQSLVLSGPEFSHSLLTTVILPRLSENKKLSLEHIDELIKMSFQTIQALGELSSASNPRSRTNYNGHHRDKKTLRAEGTMSLGELAEELLRQLINTPLPNGFADLGRIRTKKLIRLYNNTLNTWSKIAASEADPVTAKNASLRAEKLLLDLAMSKKNQQTLTSEEGETVQMSALLERVQPDIVSFNTTINTWAMSGRFENVRGEQEDVTTVAAAERAEAILRLLHDLHAESQDFGSDDDILIPDQMSYYSVIRAWSRALDPEAPTRSMAILEDMLERHYTYIPSSDTSNRPPFPNNRTFSSILTAWAKSSHADAIKNSEEILSHMKQLVDKGFEESRPDVYVYNALLHVYAKQIDIILERMLSSPKRINKRKLLEKAYIMCSRMEEIIEEMVGVSATRKGGITCQETDPNFSTHKTALYPLINIAKAMNGLKQKQQLSFNINEVISRAEIHLRKLAVLNPEHSDSSLRTNTLTIQPFEDLMAIYSTSGDYKRAKELLHIFLQTRSSSGSASQIQANRVGCEDLLIGLLRKSRKMIRPSKKELNEITVLVSDFHRDHNVQMSIIIFNHLIEAYEVLADNGINHARKADHIMAQVIETYNKSLAPIISAHNEQQPNIILRPNTFTFHNVLSAYAKSSNIPKLSHRDRQGAVLRAEQILLMMEEMNQQKFRSKHDRKSSSSFANVVPNVNSYNSLLKAYASQAKYEDKIENIKETVEKAELLLQRMNTLYESGENVRAKPDKYTYTAIFGILSEMSTQDATDRAMEIIYEAIESIDIDIALFNAVVKVATNTQKSSSHGLGMLEKLENGSYPKMKVKADKYTYSTVMAALANEGTTDAAEKVEELYVRMMDRFEIERYQDKKRAEQSIKPDIACYNSIITAWANVGTEDSCQRAETYLDRLIRDDETINVGPDRVSFSALINGYLQRNDRAAAENCERILRKMEDYQKDNNSADIRFSNYGYKRTIDKFHEQANPEACLRVLKSCSRHMDAIGYKIKSNEQARHLKNTYKTVITSFFSSGVEDKAKKIQEIFDLLEADGRVKPDYFIFRSLMNAHSLSPSPDSYKTVNNILERIITDHDQGKSDVFASIEIFNLLFKACESSPNIIATETEESPVAIAFERFSQMQSANQLGLRPTAQTYSHLLAICRNYVQDELKRNELARRLFQKCCSDGELSQGVLLICKDTMSAGHFEKLVVDLIGKRRLGKNVTLKDFPKTWCQDKIKRTTQKSSSHTSRRA